MPLKRDPLPEATPPSDILKELHEKHSNMRFVMRREDGPSVTIYAAPYRAQTETPLARLHSGTKAFLAINLSDEFAEYVRDLAGIALRGGYNVNSLEQSTEVLQQDISRIEHIVLGLENEFPNQQFTTRPLIDNFIEVATYMREASQGVPILQLDAAEGELIDVSSGPQRHIGAMALHLGSKEYDLSESMRADVTARLLQEPAQPLARTVQSIYGALNTGTTYANGIGTFALQDREVGNRVEIELVFKTALDRKTRGAPLGVFRAVDELDLIDYRKSTPGEKYGPFKGLPRRAYVELARELTLAGVRMQPLTSDPATREKLAQYIFAA